MTPRSLCYLLAISLVLHAPRRLADEFLPLFNGKDLSGWYIVLQGAERDTDPTGVITIENGAIHAYKHHRNGQPVPMGYIGTNKQYADYHLRLKYKWGKKQFPPRFLYKPDAGVYYHHVDKDVVWPQALQCQVELNGVGDLLTVGSIKVDTTIDPNTRTDTWQQYLLPEQGGVPYTTTGKGVSYTRKSDHYEHDDWNTVEIICKGAQAAQIVNGHLVNYCSNITHCPSGKDPANPTNWVPLKRGRILLEFEATEMSYKDVEIRQLAPDESLEQAVARATGKEFSAKAVQPPIAAEQAIATFQLPDAFHIELVAAEPLIEDPVAVTWDARGRLFVVEMRDYPNNPNRLGRIKLLYDDDGDGRMDRATIFADDLAFPNGALPYRDGLLVTAAPDILYLKDTDGDDRADVKQVVITGFGEGNQQLRVNGLRYGLDGWIYGANGRSNGSLRFPDQPLDQAVAITNTDFRFRLGTPDDPSSRALEPAAGMSQYGLAFDAWGNRFIAWNTIHIRHVVMERAYLDRSPFVAPGDPTAHIADADHGDAGRVYPIARVQTNFHSEPAGYFNAVSGIEIDRGGTFPAPYAGSAFVGEPLRNIVHRDELIPDGATFHARRGTHERDREFLASTDPWFRPVNLVSGPDGSLYVVDFYREWIEHPDFVPDEHEPDIDFYHGTERGRIYRVRPKAVTPHAKGAVTNLDGLLSEQLLPELAHPVGWRRETARRLLLERADDSIVPALIPAALHTGALKAVKNSLASASRRELAARGERSADLTALSRLNAISILMTKSPPCEPFGLALNQLFQDEHPRLREWGIRFNEPWIHDDDMKAMFVASLADDPDARVRFQAALSIASTSLDESKLGNPLTKIARRDLHDPWTRAAVVSSLRDQSVAFLRVWLDEMNDEPPTADEAELLTAVARTAVARGQSDRLHVLIAPPDPTLSPRTLRSMMILVGAGRARPMGDPWLALAHRLIDDSAAAIHARQLAVRLVLLDKHPEVADARKIAALIEPRAADKFQLTVVERLAASTHPGIAELLLARWPDATQTVRARIMQAMLTNHTRVAAVLNAIESGKIASAEIEFLARYRLTNWPDATLRARATALFDQAGIDRRAVVEQYQAALQLEPDAAHGAELFTTQCAACHSIRGAGGSVGPDLSAVVSRTPQQLLEDILDPNRQVSPDFIAYSLATTDGGAYLGTIVAENAVQITLRQLDGSDISIPRDRIDSFSSTGRSLMIEGFESMYSPQDVADLIAFLRGG